MKQALRRSALGNFATAPRLSLVAFYLLVNLVCPVAAPANDMLVL